MQENIGKTLITINCLDGTTRLINVVGRWSQIMANSLASDLEPRNIKYVSVSPI